MDSKSYFTYKFGKLDWSLPVESALLQIPGASEYMIRVLEMLDGVYGLAGKRVADVGGSNVSRQVADHYKISKFVCIDPVSKWHEDLQVEFDPSTYANGMVFKNDGFMDAYQQYDYFVLDEPAENIGESCREKFDIVISMSTFEHVDSISRTLNNINNMILPGGVLYATYEPVFSSAKGHHVWISPELDFHLLPELDFFHLKYTREEALEYVKKIDRLGGHADEVVRQAYDSHVINRKMLKQHIDEIFSSLFNQYAIDFWAADSMPSTEEATYFADKYGSMRYDVRGVAITAFK